MHSDRFALRLMHLSIVLILCGGIITFLLESRGQIHLRIGETTHEFMAETPGGGFEASTLPFYLTLSNFHIEHDGEAHTDYVSTVRLTHHRPMKPTPSTGVDIRMNRPLMQDGYRIIQASYDDDMQGTHLGVVYDPYGTGTVMIGYILFFFTVFYQFCLSTANILRRDKRPTLQEFTLKRLGALLIIAIAALLPLVPLAVSPLQPILRTPLLYIHVGIVILSYILLVSTMLWRSLLRPAVLLLAIGVVLGSIWGSISWGTYWSWDPKETWALITLLLYALPLHERILPVLRRPRMYRLYNLLCLLSLLITYLGVNFFMHSRHSYLF